MKEILLFSFWYLCGAISMWIFVAWVFLGDHRTKEQKKQQDIWDKEK